MNLSRIKRIERRVELPAIMGGLNIGCGETWNRHEGYIGLDINDYGQEIVWDVNDGLPVEDSSVEKIICSQVLEHLDDWIGLINECHRVLVEDGEMKLDVPDVRTSDKAYAGHHINYFDKYTFDFLQYESYAKEYGSRLWKNVEIEGKNGNLYIKMNPVK